MPQVKHLCVCVAKAHSNMDALAVCRRFVCRWWKLKDTEKNWKEEGKGEQQQKKYWNTPSLMVERINTQKKKKNSNKENES